jgi:hypothetical protein
MKTIVIANYKNSVGTEIEFPSIVMENNYDKGSVYFTDKFFFNVVLNSIKEKTNAATEIDNEELEINTLTENSIEKNSNINQFLDTIVYLYVNENDTPIYSQKIRFENVFLEKQDMESLKVKILEKIAKYITASDIIASYEVEKIIKDIIIEKINPESKKTKRGRKTKEEVKEDKEDK